MDSLLITAHPSSKGFTHKIAKAYVEGLKEKEKSYEIINLYEKENSLDFLCFEEKTQSEKNEKINYFQEKISSSKEIVFIFPIWNSTEPAILKNFYDRVFCARFAFRYTQKGAEGLLKGKNSVFFVTSDSNRYMYKLFGNPLKLIWKYFRMKFCGIKLKKYIEFDKMRLQSQEDLEKRLEKVKSIAQK